MQWSKCAVCCIALCILVGCEGERRAFVYRSPFLAANGQKPPENPTLPDGTPIEFIDKPLAQWRQERDAEASGSEIPAPPAEEIRTTAPDGSVVMVTTRPEQLIANLMTCFRNREWELVWYDLLDADVRSRWESEGGPEAFIAWCEKARKDMMEFLNRAGFGYLRTEVTIESMGANRQRIRFSPMIADKFRVTALEMSQTPNGMRLSGVTTRTRRDPESTR